jgi:hypothetical protein
MMNRFIAISFLAFLSICTPVVAHHSPAMFDMAHPVKMQGVVREFQWTNPHSYVQLLVKDSKGKEIEWSLEMGAISYLQNNGWKPSTLKAGDQISVTVAPLRNGSRGGLLMDVTMADGRKLGGGK